MLPPLPSDEIAEVAISTYVYAFPLILMEMTRRVGTNVSVASGMKAPMNQFVNVPSFPTADFLDVVRPNADTLYSVMFYDVSKEPLMISVPDSAGRYYVLQLLDMWTDVFSAPGARTTGTGALVFALTAPDWQGHLPPNTVQYRSPTAVGWLLGRTQTNGTADYEAVHVFQAGLSTTPLSGWGTVYHPAPRSINPDWDMNPPLAQVLGLNAGAYFSLFAELTALNPPHANDYPILDQMRRIGVEPGKPFSLDKVAPEAQHALVEAVNAGQDAIKTEASAVGTAKEGWVTNLSSIGCYGCDYLRRAAIAYAGLGANRVEDAIYPFAITDSDGNQLSSDKGYTLHFEKSQLPPVRAFWSLTMYDERQLFAKNQMNRYAIGDRDKLDFNVDGSLDIYVQSESPGEGRKANWLPAPARGQFTMNLRLYWPKSEALSGSWTPPAVKLVI